MLLFWHEVFLTESASTAHEIKKLLRNNNIVVKKRTFNRYRNAVRARGTMFGKIPGNPNFENQHYLYVRKKDKEMAEYLIRNPETGKIVNL